VYLDQPAFAGCGKKGYKRVVQGNKTIPEGGQKKFHDLKRGNSGSGYLSDGLYGSKKKEI